MQSEKTYIPKVSVLMTTLHSERYVHEAIHSILNQSFENLELVIVDGGSTDATTKIIREIKDERIRLFVCEGIRRSAQLNVAVNKARGELLAIMDSDDIAVSTRLSEQITFLDSHSEISIIGTWAILIFDNGVLFQKYQRPIHHRQIVRHLLAMNGMCFGTSMFRKEFFNTVGPFSETLTMAEDVDWFLRGIDLCHYANIPKALMILRQTTQSRSRSVEIQNEHLVESLINTLSTGLAMPKTRAERAARERDKGLTHYYYGDVHVARKYFISSFVIVPFDILTVRYMISSILFTQRLFINLRRNKVLRKAALAFRKMTVWKDVIIGRSIS